MASFISCSNVPKGKKLRQYEEAVARSSVRTKEKIAEISVKPRYVQELKFDSSEQRLRHFKTFRVIRSFWNTYQYDERIDQLRENAQWAKICQQEGFHEALDSILSKVKLAEDGSIPIDYSCIESVLDTANKLLRHNQLAELHGPGHPYVAPILLKILESTYYDDPWQQNSPAPPMTNTETQPKSTGASSSTGYDPQGGWDAWDPANLHPQTAGGGTVTGATAGGEPALPGQLQLPIGPVDGGSTTPEQATLRTHHMKIRRVNFDYNDGFDEYMTVDIGAQDGHSLAGIAHDMMAELYRKDFQAIEIKGTKVNEASLGITMINDMMRAAITPEMRAILTRMTSGQDSWYVHRVCETKLQHLAWLDTIGREDDRAVYLRQFIGYSLNHASKKIVSLIRNYLFKMRILIAAKINISPRCVRRWPDYVPWLTTHDAVAIDVIHWMYKTWANAAIEYTPFSMALLELANPSSHIAHFSYALKLGSPQINTIEAAPMAIILWTVFNRASTGT